MLWGRLGGARLDCQKEFGRDIRDLRAVFAAFPDAGFCLDVAHVWTNDRSLALGHALMDNFGDRLRQLHVSGIEEDGTHRPTTLDDLELYEPLLMRCPQVPWLLETELLAEDPHGANTDDRGPADPPRARSLGAGPSLRA